MKKLLFPVLSLFCAASVGAQLPASRFAEIQAAYERVVSNPDDKKAQEAFLDAFPNSWVEYILTLYQRYETPLFVDALRDRMTQVGDSVVCAKAINVSIGATDGVDDPAYLQNLQERLMRKYPDRMLQLISSMTEGDQALYWQFYWSNHLYKERIAKEMEQLRDYMLDKGYSAEAAIMENAFRGFHGKIVWPGDPFDTEHINQRQFQGQC